MGGGSPILPQPAGAPQGISDVVSQDDLTRWAQLAGVLQYFTEAVPQPARPAKAIPLAVTSSNAAFSNLYAQLRSMGVPSIVAFLWAAFWASVIGALGVLVGALVRFVATILTPLAAVVLEGLGALRQGIDPSVGILAQEVLTEFLGVEVGVANLPLGIGGADHLGRARAIGGLLYNVLEREFITAAGGSVQPSAGPAQSFSGLAVNFGLASGIMGVIGGMVPVGHVDELRELGEEVATNIGLGRLVRRALTPLITTLVSNPAQWYINTKYLPTQFKEAELVNPYAQTLLPTDQLYSAMHLLGYSDDKIAAFIKMHEKRLTPAEVALLVNYGLWDTGEAEKYLAAGGWPAGMQGTLFALEDLREQQKWYDKLLGELEAEVHAGRMTLDEFTAVLNGTAVTSILGEPGGGGQQLGTRKGLPYSDSAKQVIIATLQYKLKAGVHLRPHRLSNGELFYAFAAGLVTANDLTDRWTNLGLPQADQDTRLQLWLLHLKRMHELEDLRTKQYQEKIKAFGEKQAGSKPGPIEPFPPVPPFPLG